MTGQPLVVNPSTLMTASTGFGEIASSFFNEGAGPAVKSAAGGVSELDCGAACREVGDSLLAEAQVLGVSSNKFSDNLDSAAFYYRRGDEQAAEDLEFDTPGDGFGGRDPSDDPNDPIDQYEEELQEAGLLDGDAPPGSKYEEWLQNASANGVPPEEIVKIARDHGITPESFKVLDGLERVTDDNGKDFFLLPPGTDAETARKAALMTYVLNAGTGYGSADGNGRNDFTETPYTSAEVGRIIDRQAANSWSYEEAEALQNSGGRIVATPNGMLMGLGGSWTQDQLSRQAGSTYGDVFLVNIDDPADPGAQLKKIITDGHLSVYDENRNLVPYSIDLDRTLHHEERHSQQWAQLGPVEFGKEYLTALANEQISGTTNPFEINAGAHDGGYR